MDNLITAVVVLALMAYAFANIFFGRRRANQLAAALFPRMARAVGWFARLGILTIVNTIALAARLLTARGSGERSNALAVYAERMTDALLP